MFYIWSNNIARFPLNYTRTSSPGWRKLWQCSKKWRLEWWSECFPPWEEMRRRDRITKTESSRMEALTIWNIWLMEDANNMNGCLPKQLLHKFSGTGASTVDKNFKLQLGGGKVEKHLQKTHAIGMPDFNGQIYQGASCLIKLFCNINEFFPLKLKKYLVWCCTGKCYWKQIQKRRISAQNCKINQSLALTGIYKEQLNWREASSGDRPYFSTGLSSTL